MNPKKTAPPASFPPKTDFDSHTLLKNPFSTFIHTHTHHFHFHFENPKTFQTRLPSSQLSLNYALWSGPFSFPFFLFSSVRFLRIIDFVCISVCLYFSIISIFLIFNLLFLVIYFYACNVISIFLQFEVIALYESIDEYMNVVDPTLLSIFRG
jgi:hypothetical protein